MPAFASVSRAYFAKRFCRAKGGNWLTQNSHSCVRGIGFLQKVFQVFRHLLDRRLPVKTPELMADLRPLSGSSSQLHPRNAASVRL
jgi:hypothetical protein